MVSAYRTYSIEITTNSCLLGYILNKTRIVDSMRLSSLEKNKKEISEAREEALQKAREKSKLDRENRFYEDFMAVATYISHNPGRCLNEIARAMHWSVGKAQHVLNYGEEKDFSIESKFSIESGKAKRKFFPVPWYNSMDWANFEDNEATELMVKEVASLQTKAHEQGYNIEIKDKVLREKLKRLHQSF